MKALVIIPARLESSRLPEKMLKRLGDKTLIEWTWRAACRSGIPRLIATDSDRIASEAERFGARVVRTGSYNNGTERCAAVLRLIAEKPEIVVNWQGDSPLAPPWIAGALVRALDDTKAGVSTPIRLTGELAPGQSVAVVAPDEMALYFTRSPVPALGPWWAHIGLYAYRAKALARYGIQETPLERAERLEQIRWLELGERVRCVPLQLGDVPEVNEPRDLKIVAALLGAA